MKNRMTLLVMLALSISVFAQKKELKKADKALKKKEYVAALDLLKIAEPLLAEADTKLKEKYFYIKAKSIFGDGENREADEVSAIAFIELINFLEESGTNNRHLIEAQEKLNIIIKHYSTSASKLYKENNYKEASTEFEMVYTLSPTDTSYLDNAALSAYLDKDYDRSITCYKKLLEIGYTGISTRYRAKNIVDGEYIYFATKQDMDTRVLMKTASLPEVYQTESRKGEVAKNIALSYIAKGDDQSALDAIAEAKKSSPNDYTLVISEANIYYELGDNDKFLAGLKEAIAIKPTDPLLYYNVGVISLEQGYPEEAIKAFTKATELKPDYADAHNNIGVAILERTKPIVDEMNDNLSNFKKYDALNLKQKDVYRDALPYFEKTLELKPKDKVVLSTLVGLYELLEMYGKQKATKAILDAL